MQFGYVLLFSVPKHGDEKPQFKGVVGADDQFEYRIVSVNFLAEEVERFANKRPAIVAIVGDVEILESGLRSIRVRAVLDSPEEIQEAKDMSDSRFPGACESTFAAHWKAA